MEKLESKEGSPCDMPSEGGILWTLAALVVGSLVVGALLAPVVHTGLVARGRAVAELSFLRNISFEQVASRCVLVSIAVGLHAGWIWAMRASTSFLLPQDGRLDVFFGRGGELATGYVATLTMAGILFGMLVVWRPSMRSPR